MLLHRQADNVLRVDFQLGRDADAEEEEKTENVDRRLRLMFGPEARWEHEWTSVYTFTCRMLQRFVHGRVMFAGDAAHVASTVRRARRQRRDRRRRQPCREARPCGRPARRPRCCSTATAASAGWRHARTSSNSTRSTDFITPKFPASRAFRDAALTLAPDFPFARALINSGRAVGADGAARIAF